MSSTPPPSSATLARLGPSRLVLVVALVAFHGLVRLAERYLPEFLAALGAGPVVAGTAASLGLAVGVSVRHAEVTDVEPAAVALLSTALAAVGLLTWAGASSLDALLGIPLTAFGWILVGAALVPLWDARGPGHVLGADGDGFAPTGPLSRMGGSSTREREDIGDRDGAKVDTRAIDDRRTRIVAGAIGSAGAAVLAMAAFTGGDTPTTGFALLAAVGAAVGLITVITLAVIEQSSTDDDSVADDRSVADHLTTVTASTNIESIPTLEDVRDAYVSLPEDVRWPVLGDGLVRLGTALVSVFLVLIVVDFHTVALSVGPVGFSPVAVFGLLVLAESVGAVGGAFAVPTLKKGDVDHHWLLVGGLTTLSLFPLAIVAAPPSTAVLAVLFALFGARTALRPFRPTLDSQAIAHLDTQVDTQTASERIPALIGTAIRVALVPAPLIGGILYAISPVVVFGLATTIGLLGVRELLRTFG